MSGWWFIAGVIIGYLLRELELRYNLKCQLHTKEVRDDDWRGFM